MNEVDGHCNVFHGSTMLTKVRNYIRVYDAAAKILKQNHPDTKLCANPHRIWNESSRQAVRQITRDDRVTDCRCRTGLVCVWDHVGQSNFGARS